MVALSSPSPFIRWLIWLFPLQVILWTLLSAWTTYLSHDTFDSQPIFLRLFGDLLPMGLAISWLISANYRRSRELLQGALMALTCVAICLTVRQWYVSDNRILLNTPVRQRVIAPLQRAIPEGAVVYWEEGLHEAWFWLGRANYVSFGQLAGSVFTPRTAVEGRRRMRLLDAAGFSDNSWDFNEQIDTVMAPSIGASLDPFMAKCWKCFTHTAAITIARHGKWPFMLLSHVWFYSMLIQTFVTFI